MRDRTEENDVRQHVTCTRETGSRSGRLFVVRVDMVRSACTPNDTLLKEPRPRASVKPNRVNVLVMQRCGCYSEKRSPPPISEQQRGKRLANGEDAEGLLVRAGPL